MPEQMLNYVEAVTAALGRALEEWPEVIVYGEDLGEPGGVFGQSRGLRARFGRRVFDTPISESAILGSAVGASLFGYRPVVEVMWSDFVLVALDQLVNQAANVRYASNGQLSAPITVRMQQGALPGSCAQHSQCLEAFFAHVPGLRVGLPATPQDAHDLLLSAIGCDDPVIVVEQRGLYRGPREPVQTAAPISPVGGACVRRRGDDITIVSWSGMILRALDAAGRLEPLGISAEVIDARWLSPFDLDTVVDSVAKTGRLIIVHEANEFGGFGAEVAASVQRAAFFELDAPIVRIGLPDVRVPAAPSLQAALIPSAERITAEVQDLMKK